MDSKQIFGLRKENRLSEALELARSGLPGNESDIWYLRAYAWVLYDFAKKIVEDYEKGHLPPTVMDDRITPFMHEFTQIGAPLRRDTPFSHMLRLAGKVAHAWAGFLSFARWAGIDSFSDSDRKPIKTKGGITIDSLQMRFTRAIGRATAKKATDPNAGKGLIGWGKDILRSALENEPNDQWLNYYQSKIFASEGRTEQAVQHLVPVLRRQSKSAWPWALLGEVIEHTRKNDALICFTYATQLARKEQEVARVRIRLGQMLAAEGRFSEAAFHVKLAADYREKNGFKVPPELAQLLASAWFSKLQSSDQLEPPPEVHSSAISLIDDLDRRPLEYEIGVIDHVNSSKKLSYVATGADKGFPLFHEKFPDVKDLAPGTIIEVGRTQADSSPQKCRSSNKTSIAGLCEQFYGEIERHKGNSFAFLRSRKSDIFVPPDLASAILPGQKLKRKCLAIYRKNKNGKAGWRAIRFLD